MLATLVDEPFSREGWLVEPKLDGERCLIFKRGRELQLYSRNRKRLNEKYPEIAQALAAQDVSAYVADGEIVAGNGGIESFPLLQQRMQVSHPTRDLLRRVPVSLHLFDLLYLDRYDTRRVPQRYRKELLRHALHFDAPLHFVEHRTTHGQAFYRQACRRGLEGAIAKDGEGIYVSGRARYWRKFKCVKEQEFVVGGYTDPQGQRAGFGALLVGYYRRGKLVYAGKVGTGFDDATLERLSRRLRQLHTRTSPFAVNGLPRLGVHWVKPKLVVQIRFTDWTTDGKLRHPRYLGIRDDKNPKEVTREG